MSMGKNLKKLVLDVGRKKRMVRPGFEPGTFCVLDRCDNQLRHRTASRIFRELNNTHSHDQVHTCPHTPFKLNSQRDRCSTKLHVQDPTEIATFGS